MNLRIEVEKTNIILESKYKYIHTHTHTRTIDIGPISLVRAELIVYNVVSD